MALLYLTYRRIRILIGPVETVDNSKPMLNTQTKTQNLPVKEKSKGKT